MKKMNIIYICYRRKVSDGKDKDYLVVINIFYDAQMHHLVAKTCLCDEKTLRAHCKPVQRKPILPYFPKLPSYINDVTFEVYKRLAIYRADLKNLTYLPLRYLQMKHMDLSNI